MSDAAYYDDYGLEDRDRIESSVEVSRVSRDRFVRGTASYFTSFRTGEDNETLPRYVVDGEYTRRFKPDVIGGQAETTLSFLGLQRPSDVDVIGRDTARLSALSSWRRSWTGRNGMVGTVMGEIALDQFAVGQDSTFDSSETRVTPTLAAELRWPLERQERSGHTILEPVVQLVWSDVPDHNVPNEDSTVAEFDEAGLFDLNRFAGRDQLESGLRANLGLSYTRFDDTGWITGVTIGRVFRDNENTALAPGASPTERASDWLSTVQFDSPSGLELINRAQFSSDFSINKNALRLGWSSGESALNATYTWLRESIAEDRPNDTNELQLAGMHRLNDAWLGGFEYTYDFDTSEAKEADLSLQYRNECLVVDLSLSRDFAGAGSLRSTTDFGIKVSLVGFGAGTSGRPSASKCRR